MIHGIGVDTVDIARFEQQLERAPRLNARLFTAREEELELASRAARFAAKEALIKALGGSHDLSWHDLEVPRIPKTAPTFTRTAGLNRVLAQRGADTVHLSLTHDGGMATAFVVVEGGPQPTVEDSDGDDE